MRASATVASRRRTPEGERGQIIVVFALALITIVGMVALIVEGGNAWAQQRVVQNGADAAANAGAVVLAERLGGATRDDAAVLAAMNTVADENQIGARTGRYTDVRGQYLDESGAVVADADDAAVVGNGTIPAGAQGVRVGGTRTFGTSFGRAIGFNSFDASAEATVVAGPLTGGSFLPVVFPVNIVDCMQNGDLGTGEAGWKLSQPDGPDADSNPDGQEYIIPLCKTGDGNFQVLDLDPNQTCAEEATNGVSVNWPVLPVDVPSDNGNDCAKKIAEVVNANLRGKTVLIPICEVDCITTGGSKASYTIVKIAAFHIDYMHDSNQHNQISAECQGNGTLQPIRGNGSSSCLVGWFVRYISAGPVGTGSVGTSDAIGLQLIR